MEIIFQFQSEFLPRVTGASGTSMSGYVGIIYFRENFIELNMKSKKWNDKIHLCTNSLDCFNCFMWLVNSVLRTCHKFKHRVAL